MKRSNTIYADYQATTPLDPQVLEQMLPFWKESFGNPHSNDHVVGWRSADAVSEAAASVGSLIGGDPDEIIFTSGATEANNLALLGLARRAQPKRRRVLVSAIEHKCVLAAARSLEGREGFTVETIPVDVEGFVDLEALEGMVDETVLVASVMAVNNEIGTIQDLPRIATLLRRHGVLFHCDAAQAPCAMDVSHLARHADLISLSGHKMYGHRESELCTSAATCKSTSSRSCMAVGSKPGYGRAQSRSPCASGWQQPQSWLVLRRALLNGSGSDDCVIHSLSWCDAAAFL